MKRISTSTAIQSRFVDGNKSTGQKATQFSAEWCNQIQEELANLLVLNGITLGASEHQIFDLFAKFFTSGFSSISYTVGDVTINIGSDGKVIVRHKNTDGLYAVLELGKIRVQTPGQGSEITPGGFSHSSEGGNSVNLDDNGLRFGRVGNKIGGMNYDGSKDAMVFDKPVKVDEYLVGNKYKVVATGSRSGAGLSVEYLEDGDWVQKAFFSADGKKLQVKAQLAHTASNWIYSTSDVDFRQTGTHDLTNYEVDAPFAVFNTNDHGGAPIQVIDSTGNRVYGVEAGCARWFVKTKVGSTDTLFAFGKEP